MNKIDVAGIAQQSAIEGLTALVGGLTQGAFVEAIATRYGERLVAAGLSVKTARAVMSSGAAFTAGFYNTGARIVLDKVIAGKSLPSSVAELSDMVASEAFRSAAMDLGSGYLHALGAAKASTPAESREEFTLDNAATGPDAAPKEVLEGLARPAPHEDPVLEDPMAAGSPVGPVAGRTRATPEAYALAEQLAPYGPSGAGCRRASGSRR